MTAVSWGRRSVPRLRSSGLAPARLQPSRKVICNVDVSWEAQIVARHEDGAEAAGPVVGDEGPGAAGEHDGVAADAAVARRDDRLSPLARRGDDPIDRCRRELRAVDEHDDRRLDIRSERSQTAPERCARPELPVRAANDALARGDLVRAENDHDLVDAARAHALEDGLEQEALLRRAEARRGSGCKDDGGDQGRQRQRRSERQRAVTFATYVSVWPVGAPPARSTADGPAL